MSALRWLARRGARLVAIDSRTAPPHLAELAQLAPEAELRAGPSHRRQLCRLPAAGGQALACLGHARKSWRLPRLAARWIGDVELFARAIAGQVTR